MRVSGNCHDVVAHLSEERITENTEQARGRGEGNGKARRGGPSIAVLHGESTCHFHLSIVCHFPRMCWRMAIFERRMEGCCKMPVYSKT